MAHALQIDTLAFTKKLRDAGAEEGLAEAIVEGLSAADTSELATKSDTLLVENKIAEVKAELKQDIAEVKTGIADAKSELFKWGAGALFVQLGFIFAMLRFMVG